MKKLLITILFILYPFIVIADQVGGSTQPVSPHNHSSINDGGIIKPFYESILSAPTTTITVTGLDAIANNGYRIEIYFASTGTNIGLINFYINGDFTDANYNSDILTTSASTYTHTNVNNSRFSSTSMGLGQFLYTTGTINLIANNIPVGFFTTNNMSTGGNGTIDFVAWRYKNTQANITRIDINSSISQFGAGTRIRVWNLK